MTKPKYLGSIRQVLTGLAFDFMVINRDMEVTSAEELRRGATRGDLFQRAYTFPEMEVNINCRASMKNGKIHLFGKNESIENSIDITIRAPFITSKLNIRQIEEIIKMNEDEAKTKLEEQGISTETTGTGFFIPDDE